MNYKKSIIPQKEREYCREGNDNKILEAGRNKKFQVLENVILKPMMREAEKVPGLDGRIVKRLRNWRYQDPWERGQHRMLNMRYSG